MSKFFTLFVGIFLFSLYSQAQIKRGVGLLGGSVNFISRSTHNNPGNVTYDYKFTGLGFYPSAGYLVADNLAIGLGLGYQTNNNEQSSNYNTTPVKSTSHTFFVGPFVRYYKMLNEQISIFGQGTATLGFGKSENTYQDAQPYQAKGDINSLNVGIRPGIVWFATQRLAFEATYGVLEYNHSKTTTDFTNGSPANKIKDNYFNLSFNPSSLGFGLWYYPGR